MATLEEIKADIRTELQTLRDGDGIYKLVDNVWIDVLSKDGAIKAAGFSIGYGGFATAILQYRVTIAAIPLIPIMDKYAVPVVTKFFGDKFGAKKDEEVEIKGKGKGKSKAKKK